MVVHGVSGSKGTATSLSASLDLRFALSPAPRCGVSRSSSGRQNLLWAKLECGSLL